MEEELKSKESDLDALRSEADRLLKEGNFQGALDLYLKLDRAIPDNLDLIYCIVICYFNLDDYENAIKYYAPIFNSDKVKDEKRECILNFNIGIYFFSQKKYLDAIPYFIKCTTLSTDNSSYFYYIGCCYLYLDNLDKAAEFYVKSKFDILQIKCYLDKNDLISLMLDYEVKSGDNSTLFSKAMSDGEIKDTNSADYNKYKDIYIKVLEIIAWLHVDNENEKSVAHYTRMSTAEQLIFNDSSFRLNTILTANDPKEGLDLFEFLNLPETDNDVSSDFQAFIGSFTFNHDSLNQFRLYGKENDKEATGISIVLNSSFFNGLIANCVNSSSVLDDNRIDGKINYKKPLFRCIYVDPISKQLISIGQREMWTFYREHGVFGENLFDTYKEYTDKIFSKVKELLKDLNDIIDNLENKKANVLSELLLMLRYLTKNMAFKEEQECRVLTIENITQNPDILPRKEDRDFTQMYIKYRTLKNCIKKVYFAPKAKGKEMFNIQIKRFGLDIECHESTHKIS